MTTNRSETILTELGRVDGDDPSKGSLEYKHARMLESPFRFMRGACQLYYADLASGVVTLPAPFANPAHLTAIIGDCHLNNFGFVTEKGSHGDHIIFTPDDFDDACIGPAGWDLLRFLTSIFLTLDLAQGLVEGRYASEEVDDPGGRLQAPGRKHASRASRAFLKAYRKTCEALIEDPSVRRQVLSEFDKGHVLRSFMKKARKRAIGGKKFKTKSKLGKAVEIDGNVLHFRDRPGRYRRLDAVTAAQVRAAFRPYVDDAILDVVKRLGQGTGSLNVDRYYLLVGPDGASTHAELPLCHLVEVKQQRPAAPLHHFPDIDPRNSIEPAHLTVDLQRLVQREPDRLLDEVTWRGVQWLVRSRHHAKVGAEPEEIALAKSAKAAARQLVEYCEACGHVLALAHSRGDYRSARFETAMAAAIDEAGEALIESAELYAVRTTEDWSLMHAVANEDAAPAD